MKYLRLECESVELSPGGSRSIMADINGIEDSEILDHFTIGDVIDHFGTNEILEWIGVDNSKNYFGLTEQD